MAKPKKITSDDEGKLLELKDYLKVKQKYYKKGCEAYYGDTYIYWTRDSLNVTTYVDGNEDWFYGNCQISKANMFTIKQIDPPIELQCEINNDKLW